MLTSLLVVDLLKIVSRLDEGRSNLTAGGFNSTIPLVTGWFTRVPILAERRVMSCSHFFDWQRCWFAPIVHIDGMAQLADFVSRHRQELSLEFVEWDMCRLRLGCDDGQAWVELAVDSGELVVLMCPKPIWRFHPKFASRAKFIDGCQLGLVNLDVVRLPLGLRLMIHDYVVVWWSLGQIRVVLLVFHIAFRHVFIYGWKSSSGSLRSRSVRSSHPRVDPRFVEH